MTSLPQIGFLRSVVGYLTTAFSGALVLAPFVLKLEYCDRPTYGGILMAAISGWYLSERLVRGGGSLGSAYVTRDMPAPIKVATDVVALGMFVLAAWFIVGACRGSAWPP